MDSHRTSILEALNTAEIAHTPSSLTKHHTQGLMSSVYTIDSDIGGLIIHVSALTPSLEYFTVWEKLKPISEFLRNIGGVPAAEVLFTLKWPKHFVVVQRRLPGQSAGSVEFKDGRVAFSWANDLASLESQLEEIIARIHSAPLSGFGQLEFNKGILRGKHDSWKAFLEVDSEIWLEGIREADAERDLLHDSLIDDMRSFFKQTIPFLDSLDHASLVSSDIMNPSNILVEQGAITGIVDWEWAVAADPAWEFCYTNRFSLSHYFSAFPSLTSEESRNMFRLRAEAYEYYIYAMWCYAVSGEPHSDFYQITRDRLQKHLLGGAELLQRLPALLTFTQNT